MASWPDRVFGHRVRSLLVRVLLNSNWYMSNHVWFNRFKDQVCGQLGVQHQGPDVIHHHNCLSYSFDFFSSCLFAPVVSSGISAEMAGQPNQLKDRCISTWFGTWLPRPWEKHYMMFLEDPFDSADNTARSLGTGGLDQAVGAYFLHLFQRSAEVLRWGIRQDLPYSPVPSSSSSSTMQMAASVVWLFGADVLFSLDPSSAWTLLGLTGPQFSQLEQEWTTQQRQQQQCNRGSLADSNVASACNFRAVLQGLVGPGGVVEEPLCLEEWQRREEQQQKVAKAAAAAAHQEQLEQQRAAKIAAAAAQQEQLEKQRAAKVAAAAAQQEQLEQQRAAKIAAAAAQQEQLQQQRAAKTAAAAAQQEQLEKQRAAKVAAAAAQQEQLQWQQQQRAAKIAAAAVHQEQLQQQKAAKFAALLVQQEQLQRAAKIAAAAAQQEQLAQQRATKVVAPAAQQEQQQEEEERALVPSSAAAIAAAAQQRQQEEQKRSPAASSSAAAPAITAKPGSTGSAAASTTSAAVLAQAGVWPGVSIDCDLQQQYAVQHIVSLEHQKLAPGGTTFGEVDQLFAPCGPISSISLVPSKSGMMLSIYVCFASVSGALVARQRDGGRVKIGRHTISVQPMPMGLFRKLLVKHDLVAVDASAAAAAAAASTGLAAAAAAAGLEAAARVAKLAAESHAKLALFNDSISRRSSSSGSLASGLSGAGGSAASSLAATAAAGGGGGGASAASCLASAAAAGGGSAASSLAATAAGGGGGASAASCHAAAAGGGSAASSLAAGGGGGGGSAASGRASAADDIGCGGGNATSAMPHCIAAVAGPGYPGCSNSTGGSRIHSGVDQCTGNAIPSRATGAPTSSTSADSGGSSYQYVRGPGIDWRTGTSVSCFCLRAVQMQSAAPWVSKAEVLAAFGQFGPIKAISITLSKTKKSARVCVEFIAADSAAAALARPRLRLCGSEGIVVPISVAEYEKVTLTDVTTPGFFSEFGRPGSSGRDGSGNLGDGGSGGAGGNRSSSSKSSGMVGSQLQRSNPMGNVGNTDGIGTSLAFGSAATEGRQPGWSSSWTTAAAVVAAAALGLLAGAVGSGRK